jgi:hypothetical protein
MNQQQVNSNLSIEWYRKENSKFFVKFKSIDVPIEMNQTYFDNVLKHLQN